MQAWTYYLIAYLHCMNDVPGNLALACCIAASGVSVHEHKVLAKDGRLQVYAWPTKQVHFLHHASFSSLLNDVWLTTHSLTITFRWVSGWGSARAWAAASLANCHVMMTTFQIADNCSVC